jgi:hypothetical protein
MMKRALVTAALGWLVAAGLMLAPKAAHAYPQWQYSSGTVRCGQCHYSPSGGGTVNGYARDAVGEDLSTWEGDGSFMHGAVDLPKTVALQFDGRYAAMIHDVGEKRGAKQLLFPMQADLSGRFALSEAVSLHLSVGYRGAARVGDEPTGAGAAAPDGSSRFISREHYLMWRPSATGAYVRAGRFFAPFGLRLAEHYAYVRRDIGFNTLEESYNVSGGYVDTGWELHLTAFAPDVLRHIGSDESGGAGLFELRTGEANSIGLQARAGLKAGRNRFIGGAFGKSYIASIKTLFQVEGNVVHSIYANNFANNGFVGYAGITFFPFKGMWLTPFAERSQTDITVRDSATNAGGVQANWFPYPHFELTVLGRVQLPAGNDTGAKTLLAFIHYYL